MTPPDELGHDDSTRWDSGSEAESETTPESEAQPEPFSLPIREVRPSQLYLNGRKLSLVTQWFDFTDPNYDPLPVRRFETERADARWTLTDGHTRAFVAHLAGADELRVVYDADDLDVATYRQCVEWCEQEGVTEIADLTGHVLDADDFEEKWVARCQAVAEPGE